MKNIFPFFASIVQLIIGLCGILAFAVLAIAGEVMVK